MEGEGGAAGVKREDLVAGAQELGVDLDDVESCLSLHPAVLEVAVVGIPDERWGKIIAAFVKRGAPVEAEELNQFCQTSGLANFKRPRRFVFVADVPKSPVGKLLRRQLKERFREQTQAGFALRDS